MSNNFPPFSCFSLLGVWVVRVHCMNWKTWIPHSFYSFRFRLPLRLHQAHHHHHPQRDIKLAVLAAKALINIRPLWSPDLCTSSSSSSSSSLLYGTFGTTSVRCQSYRSFVANCSSSSSSILTSIQTVTGSVPPPPPPKLKTRQRTKHNQISTLIAPKTPIK